MMTRRQLLTWWRHAPAPVARSNTRAPRPELARLVAEPVWQDAAVVEPSEARPFSLDEFYAARARARQ